MTDVQREILNAFVASAAELANLATHMHRWERILFSSACI